MVVGRFLRRHLVATILIGALAVVGLVLWPHAYGTSATHNQGIVVNLPWCSGAGTGYEMRGDQGWFYCNN
jgi:hypothetical protein